MCHCIPQQSATGVSGATYVSVTIKLTYTTFGRSLHRNCHSLASAAPWREYHSPKRGRAWVNALSGSRQVYTSRPRHLIWHAIVAGASSIGRLPFFGASPRRPECTCDDENEGERRGHRQCSFRNSQACCPRPEARSSRSHRVVEVQTSTGPRVPAGVPWSKDSPRSFKVTGINNLQTSFPLVKDG